MGNAHKTRSAGGASGANGNPLALFHPAVRAWFESSFAAPTKPQLLGWPAIARGDSTLILAPTGTGKTLTAFLWCINRLMFAPAPPQKNRRCRVLYISPIKALAVDIDRNLRAPLRSADQVRQDAASVWRDRQAHWFNSREESSLNEIWYPRKRCSSITYFPEA